MRVSAVLIGLGLAGVSAAPALASNPDQMRDACRVYASKHLHVDAGLINASYEGQRTDGTHAVNGDTEGSASVRFQCTFRADGKRIIRWWHESPQGCPADVSEANRHMYPDCG